jgi:hypothetical protein
MIEITLTQGLVTQLDDEFEFLDQYKWYAKKDTSIKNIQYYVARTMRSHGVQSTIRMHRVIMESVLNRPLLRTEQIDHINNDGLKNTLDNLRIATNQQNCTNCRKRNVITYSHYKGVTWYKDRSKWVAQIQRDGKNMYLGGFVIESDAAHAYDAAAKLYFGEYTNLNFKEN